MTTKTEIKEQALTQLSPEERLELAVDLWESIEPGDIAVPDWHLEIVRERLAEHRRDPESARPGEELLAWLRQPRA
ncbi:MAG TPA: addiction module protein [Thermoanaerobaculia bacterium]|nr:addiction module protein [Thermoanaerobaculia bacterium]